MPVEIFVQEQGKLVTVWLTRKKLIQVILDAQLSDGGWDLSAGKADPDMTAMAIQALAPYYKTSETVKAAVDKALEALSALQRSGGGFRHTAGGERNGMATEQGYYALAAYYRFVNAQTRLYDMTDVTIQTGGSNTPATGDTGVLVWVIALPVTILAAAFVLKRKEREA